jgi:hypothetical protein
MSKLELARFAFAVAAPFIASPGVALDAYPIPKDGFCPSGYHQSGNYCVPSSEHTGAAIIKEGFCPTGYHASGNYCVANNASSGRAILKDGFCPSGFHASGNYCVEN